jgi:hypothetical protein
MFHYIFPAINDIAILSNFLNIPQSIERYKPRIIQRRKQVPTAPSDTNLPSDPEPVKPRRSGQTSQAPDKLSPDKYDSSYTSLTTSLSSISIPTCYSQTVKGVRGIKAINEELQALQENFTWDIVSCPPDIKPIGCKWVYSINHVTIPHLQNFEAKSNMIRDKETNPDKPLDNYLSICSSQFSIQYIDEN